MEVEMFKSLLNKESLHLVCRCCLSQDNVINIFELAYDTEMFIDIFSELLSVSVNSNNDMPKNICERCLRKITHFYNFRNNCYKVEQVLLTCIREETVNPQNGLKENIKIVDCDNNESFAKMQDNLDTINVVKEHENYIHEENNIIDKEKNQLDDVSKESYFIKLSALPSESDSLLQNIQIPKKSIKLLPRRFRPLEDPIMCSCNKMFNTKALYEKHQKEVEDCHPYYVCKICNKSFSRKGFKFHKYSHMKEKMFECNICNKKFSMPCTLYRHKVVHKEKGFVCEVCGKSFNRLPYLTEHKAHHTNEHPYLCDRCGRCFKLSGTYRMHLRMHNQQENFKKNDYTENQLSSGDPVKKNNYRSEVRPLPCTDCNMEFKRADHYNSHIEKVHGEGKTEADDSEELNFMCERCKKFYSTKTFLDNHFQIHVMTERSTKIAKIYACEKCDKSFTSSTALKAHSNRHTGYKPYFCQICYKRFYVAGHLNHHLKMHAGQKYTCNYCNKSFTSSDSLTRHLRLHTGVKYTYQCNECPRTFLDKGSRGRHKREKHGKRVSTD